MAEDMPKPRRLKTKARAVKDLARLDDSKKQPSRLRRAASRLGKVRKPRSSEKTEEIPKSKVGRVWKRRPHLIPRYFRNSWEELKGVTWPSRRETRQLTIAVFIFAIVFGIIITITDYGLDKIFKKVLIK